MAAKIQNGRGTLEAAMALLLQSQVQFHAEMVKIHKDVDEIMRTLARHEYMLANLSTAMANLPEAIREKIGFKK